MNSHNRVTVTIIMVTQPNSQMWMPNAEEQAPKEGFRKAFLQGGQPGGERGGLDRVGMQWRDLLRPEGLSHRWLSWLEACWDPEGCIGPEPEPPEGRRCKAPNVDWASSELLTR